MRLNSYLTFNGNCEKAFRLYEQILGGKIEYLMKYRGTPMEQQVPAGWRDKILHATLAVGGCILQGVDSLPGQYQNPQGFSVNLNLKDLADAERIFKALAEEGMVQIALQQTFWAARFGIYKTQTLTSPQFTKNRSET